MVTFYIRIESRNAHKLVTPMFSVTLQPAEMNDWIEFIVSDEPSTSVRVDHVYDIKYEHENILAGVNTNISILMIMNKDIIFPEEGLLLYY